MVPSGFDYQFRIDACLFEFLDHTPGARQHFAGNAPDVDVSSFKKTINHAD